MVLSAERKWIENQARPNGGDWKISFTVDDITDISELPIIGQEYSGIKVDGRAIVISGADSAFVVNSSAAYMLGSSGWSQI